MKKGFLLIAVLLLSATWVVAQSTSSEPVHRSTNPTGDNATQPGNADTSAASPSNTNVKDDTANVNGTMNGKTAMANGADNNGAPINHLRGCLSGSAGSYTLTDSASGKTYMLTGKTDKLNAHVGHEVEVKGSAAPASANAASPSSAAAANPAGTDSFDVSGVKMISKSCSMSANPSAPPSNK